MLTKRIPVLFFVLFMAIKTNGQMSYTSIAELAKNAKIELELKGLGGYQGGCVEINVQNLSPEQQNIWLEAGRRLDNSDPGEQDILIVKEQKFQLNPKEIRTITAFGFCCMAHNGAPSADRKFSIGWMETGNLLWIAQYLNGTNNIDNGIVQQAVWVFSNGNNPASILNSKEENVLELKKAIAAKLNIEIPWYEIYYERDSARVFSDGHYKLKGPIEYSLPNRGWLSMIVRSPQRQIIHRFTNTAFVEGGRYNYDVDLDIKNWPKGKYDLEIYLDDVLKKKINFTI